MRNSICIWNNKGTRDHSMLPAQNSQEKLHQPNRPLVRRTSEERVDLKCDNAWGVEVT